MPRLAALPKGFFAALVERRMTVFQTAELGGKYCAPLVVADHELRPSADGDRLDEIIHTFVRRVKEG